MAFAKASESTYGIAKLVGEGFGRPQAIDESPVDIQYGKLAEWLVRHTCHLGTGSTHVLIKSLSVCRQSGSISQLTGGNA